MGDEKLVLNVLSIDMDWIMAPSIEAYNHLVYTNKGISLDDVLNTYMPGINVEADMEKFYQIIRLILTAADGIERKNKGYSNRHDDIIGFLDLKEMQKINLFNIDHHHDLGYDSLAPGDKYYHLNCGNWVNNLANKGIIETYGWVNNETSILPDQDHLKNISNYFISKDINILSNTTFDKIFISGSPEWLPKKYHFLTKTANSVLDAY